MCWVMPPASPLTTSVWRSASSSDVLPWSTCPMTVTTGERGSRVSGGSSSDPSPISTSASLTRRTRWPNSAAATSAVSASMIASMPVISPMRINALTTSTARSAMRFANSCTEMVSGITTSRITFFGAVPWAKRRSRSRWRRTEARLRTRSSSLSAWVRVILRALRRAPPGVLRGTTGRRGNSRRPWRGGSVRSSEAGSVSLRAAVSSAFLRAASSSLLRASSNSFRWSASSRSLASRASSSR